MESFQEIDQTVTANLENYEKMLSSSDFDSVEGQKVLTDLFYGIKVNLESKPQSFTQVKALFNNSDFDTSRIIRMATALKLLSARTKLTSELRSFFTKAKTDVKTLLSQTSELNEAEQRILSNTLMDYPEFKVLDFSNEQIIAESFHTVLRIVSYASSLNLRGSLEKVKPEDWGLVAYSLKNLIELRNLDLSNNDLSSIQPIKLRDLFSAMPKLTTLIMKNGNLRLLNMLLHSTQLTTLDLEGSIKLTTERELRLFYRLLVESPSLTSLNLSNNRFGCMDEAHELFCSALSNARKITLLNLENNQLDKLSIHNWKLFCESLIKMPYLISLNLQGNQIENNPEHWITFCEALPNMTKLSSLTIFNQTLDETAGTQFLEGVEYNFSLEAVTIPDSFDMNSQQRIQLHKFLERNRELREVGENANVLISEIEAGKVDLEQETSDSARRLSSIITANVKYTTHTPVALLLRDIMKLRNNLEKINGSISKAAAFSKDLDNLLNDPEFSTDKTALTRLLLGNDFSYSLVNASSTRIALAGFFSKISQSISKPTTSKVYLTIKSHLEDLDPEIQRRTRAAIALKLLEKAPYFKALQTAISQLKHIDFMFFVHQGSHLNPTDLRILFCLLQDIPAYSCLEFSKDAFLTVDFKILSEALKATPQLRSVHILPSDQYTHEHWCQIIELLRSLPNLDHLDLSDVNLKKLSDDARTLLFGTIEEMPHLTTLSMNYTNLSSLDFDSLHYFRDVISNAKHLASLHLKGNLFSDSENEDMLFAIKDSKSLIEITFTTRPSDSFIQEVSSILERNRASLNQTSSPSKNPI